MELPKRKPQRLKNYDYSQNNAYFITICTQNRLSLFGEISNNTVVLNHAGKMVEERLLNIAVKPNITVDKYCIMPDHIHAIIVISQDGTTQRSFPTLSELVKNFKTITTKLYIDGVKNNKLPPFGQKIWQKSFNGRIIRNDQEYQEIWKYIDTNPMNRDEEH